MESSVRVINNLYNLFSGNISKDVIEAILENCNFNEAIAFDHLVLLTESNSFEIPMLDDESNDISGCIDKMENLTLSEPNHSNGNTLHNSSVTVETFNENDLLKEDEQYSDNDAIILEEEEYVLSGDADSDDDPQTDANSNNGNGTTVVNITADVPSPTYLDFVPKKPLTYGSKPPSIVYCGFVSFAHIQRTRESIERVKLFVEGGFKIMVIMRGCPGSGKTTLSHEILDNCNISQNHLHHIHSSDNYWRLNEHGEYRHNHDKLPESHKWNEIGVMNVMKEGLTPIIIDNTNKQGWEMQPYVFMAVCCGYEIEIIEPDTPWAFHARELAKRNTHKVTEDVINRYLDHYDHNISPSVLMKAFKLEYPTECTPPKRGVRTLNNPKLLEYFNALKWILRERPSTSSQTPKNMSKKQKKKLRQQRDDEISRLANEIQGCYGGEQKSGNEKKNKKKKKEKLPKNKLRRVAEKIAYDDDDDDESSEDDDSSCNANQFSAIADSSVDTIEDEMPECSNSKKRNAKKMKIQVVADIEDLEEDDDSVSNEDFSSCMSSSIECSTDDDSSDLDDASDEEVDDVENAVNFEDVLKTNKHSANIDLINVSDFVTNSDVDLLQIPPRSSSDTTNDATSVPFVIDQFNTEAALTEINTPALTPPYFSTPVRGERKNIMMPQHCAQWKNCLEELFEPPGSPPAQKRKWFK